MTVGFSKTGEQAVGVAAVRSTALDGLVPADVELALVRVLRSVDEQDREWVVAMWLADHQSEVGAVLRKAVAECDAVGFPFLATVMKSVAASDDVLPLGHDVVGDAVVEEQGISPEQFVDSRDGGPVPDRVCCGQSGGLA